MTSDLTWVVIGGVAAAGMMPLCFLAILYVRADLYRNRMKREQARRMETEAPARPLEAVTKDAFEDFLTR